jgi:hypothetical protein
MTSWARGVVGVAIIILSIIVLLMFWPKEETVIETSTNKEMKETKTEVTEQKPYEVIGTSVEGREIQAYRFGSGGKQVVFVGAIHGGYEWNTALLAYRLIDHLTEHPEAIPEGVSVVVIPAANPDGLAKVVGTSERFAIEDAPKFEFASEVDIESNVAQGRFNANGVDINRNFDCKWQSEALWMTHKVDAGTEAFSEPEAAALRDFFLEEKPKAVVFYHSASDGVYTSFCDKEPLPETDELLKVYTEASGYPDFGDFQQHYEITGDAGDWLSTIGIASIAVELATHEVIEWEKNWRGIEATLGLYKK